MYRKVLLFAALAVVSCKESGKQAQAETTDKPTAELTAPERLAASHGYANWGDVSEIRFTFNVDRDTMHFERGWIWNVRENRVTRIMGEDTLSYLRSEVDSTLAQADGSFVNDKYWFLAPFQGVWDQESVQWEMEEGATAPISGETMDKLTLVYGDSGGYTPGDAYDLYIGADSLVAEWVFRRGNQPEPSLASTWEGYEEHGGLKLSTMHQNKEGFKLYFTGVSVE